MFIVVRASVYHIMSLYQPHSLYMILPCSSSLPLFPLCIAMATPDFASLPRFDARDFDPPAWAKEARFAWSTEDDQSSEAFKRSADVKPSNSVANGGDDTGAESDNEEDHEDWQDAVENPGDLDPLDAIFSVDDLQVCVLSPKRIRLI